MTLENFSSGFDTLLSSYMLPAQVGEEASRTTLALDEYEKSLYLTKSEEEIVLSLYNGKNSSGEGFESVEENRRYLANLVEDDTLEPVETSASGVSTTSKFFELPEDLWFITYESVSITGGKCEGSTTLDVYPVTQDEYNKVRRNPFRGANDMRALRLDISDGMVEIVSKYDITSYYLRYLRKPAPIVLIDLPDGLTINGESSATGCELHEALHQRILERAVLMAMQSRGMYGNNRE